MMRSSVDLPHPEAPIRQTNSPFSITRFTLRNASTCSLPIMKVLPTSWTARNDLRGAMLSTMLRAPAQDAIVERDDQPVGRKAGETDDDHAGDHEVGAGQRASVHDHRAEPRRHASHLAHHDEDPREAVREAEPVENARGRGRQHDLAEHAGAVATEHRSRLEKLRIDGPYAEDRVEHDRIESAEEDEKDRGARAQPEED